MAHLKRHKVPKTWPIHRKGTTFVVRPNSNLNDGIPVLVLLRDLLGIAQNRKEVKRAIHMKHLLVNGKLVRDEKNGVVMFDTLTIVPAKKSYRLGLSEKGKFVLDEIKEAETGSKVVKIINKKTLKGKKTQLNLSDGRNFISDVKCGVGDSVVIDFKAKKIVKCIPLSKKANVVVFGGKHAGAKGIINKINVERKMAELVIGENNVNVLIKQLMVVE